MMKNTSLVGKPAPKQTIIRCDCGVDRELNLQNPYKLVLDCPNPECRKVYTLEYHGRRPVTEKLSA